MSQLQCEMIILVCFAIWLIAGLAASVIVLHEDKKMGYQYEGNEKVEQFVIGILGGLIFFIMIVAVIIYRKIKDKGGNDK